MISTKSKQRILENFYTIDLILLGKPLTEVKEEVCCPFFIEEYLQLKGALLSTISEIYNMIGHEPRRSNKSLKEMQENAIISARASKKAAKKLLMTESGTELVQTILNESMSMNKDVNPEEIIPGIIQEKAYSLALDNLLIGKTVTESKNFTSLNTWNGRVYEDSYKKLRGMLVESAIFINNEIRK